MKCRQTIIALTAGILFVTRIVAPASVELVRDGQPVARLYHAPISGEPLPRAFEDAGSYIRDYTRVPIPELNEMTLATAIDDLQYHLQQMSGVTLDIVETDDPATVTAPAIVIGSLAAAMGTAPTEFPDDAEAFRIRTHDGMVLIAGQGEYSEIGASHGIYTLLYQLGCDWVFPGLEGEIIPRQTTWVVERQDKQSAPSFNPRHAWYGGMQRDREAQFEFFRWLLRMRMHANRVMIDDAMTVGGHGSTARFQNFRKDIEEGLENPPSVQEAIDSIRQRFEDNGWPNDKRVCIPMGPGDGFRDGMEYTDRKAIDSGRPDGTDLIVRFFNTILEQTEDEFPNLHIGFYLYSWHADYPKIHKPHPRVAIEVADLNFSRLHGISCPGSKQRAYFRHVMDLWGQLHEEQGNVIYRYYYGYNVANGYLPISKLHIWGDGIPYSHSIGASGIRFNLYDNWEVAGANNYVGARMAWDHTLQWREILREFCEKAYGNAAAEMERYFLAMADRQRDAGREAGSFFAYRLMHDYDFLDAMDAILARAHRLAETDIAETRVEYAMIQPRRLRMYLNMHNKMGAFDFRGAHAEFERMLETHAADEERNRQFASAMGAQFLTIFHERILDGAVNYSTEPYRILYRIPERLTTALDRKVVGDQMRFYGRDINDSLYIKTSTYNATWDAQGFDGYRKGAVWYRIPFRLETETVSWWRRIFRGGPEPAATDEEQGIGLFIGGGEGIVNVWCNEQFVTRGRASLARPMLVDLTDFIDEAGENLLALQFNRVGNDELGTGGLTHPSFLFAGPRVAMEDVDQRPFRVIPGGIYEYTD